MMQRNTQILFRINDDLKESFRKVAHNNGDSISNYLNRMIRNEVSSK